MLALPDVLESYDPDPRIASAPYGKNKGARDDHRARDFMYHPIAFGSCSEIVLDKLTPRRKLDTANGMHTKNKAHYATGGPIYYGGSRPLNWVIYRRLRIPNSFQDRARHAIGSVAHPAILCRRFAPSHEVGTRDAASCWIFTASYAATWQNCSV